MMDVDFVNNNNNQFLYSAFHNNPINALYISALVMGPITSFFNVSQLPWDYTTWATVYIAPKAFSFTISISTLAGTHLYPWVKRSNYSKESCSRTQVSRPGFEPALCFV